MRHLSSFGCVIPSFRVCILFLFLSDPYFHATPLAMSRRQDANMGIGTMGHDLVDAELGW
jgi:hypothetical protein